MGLLFLPTKFELDWFTNNGDLLSDRKNGNIDTQTETDTLPIYDIGSGKKKTKKHSENTDTSTYVTFDLDV